MTNLALSGLAAETYVLLTTYRKSGEAVSTPVWIAQSADGQVLVTTGETSGKVKRIRQNPQVELVACDMRGGIREGATPVQAYAEIAPDADTRVLIEAALKEKYGVRYTAVRLAGALKSKTAGSVVLRISTVATETTATD
ncbi:PPOX class F420-dependent oxidoreductase [Glaciibacter psychrotolerans]|uniref:Pyridoxamine 5'-phosphate oxidase N-terminal domain-containing protein n=1 Tax=Glaciibacter psychrotolerans TaxID=670054 RepID=A0A7Z0EEE6_9MICO|nr:PPOX class F420-dependent oxidoreductase [Leifsonia psychrotolerans]NYJ19690.1 hypothetical protein [Leifsonia psychrotolerans]